MCCVDFSAYMFHGRKMYFSSEEAKKYILVLKAENFGSKDSAIKRPRPKEAKKLIDKWNSSGIPPSSEN